MNYADIANPGLLDQPTYEPGKPIESVAREYGLDPDAIAKLASNENPHGPSPKAVEAGKLALDVAHLYPDGGTHELRAAIAKARGVDSEQVIVGNGSNELLELLGHAFLRPGVEAVMGDQAFIVYKLVAKLFGATPVEVPMKNFAHDLDAMLAAVTDRTRLFFVASPNNPTGAANTESELIEIARALPDHVLLCLDEAYAEYLERAPDLRALISEGRKVICLRTFSKIYGLGGLRVGYAYGAPDLIALLHRARQPFNVGVVSQAAAVAALGDLDFVEQCRHLNAAGRSWLAAELNAVGLETFEGEANFVLTRVGNGVDCFSKLQSEGVIIRPLAPYGMSEYVRITVGLETENRRVLESLKRYRERVAVDLT